MRTLTALTGRHRMPPKWALGPMFDRLVRNSDETVPHYESELRDDIVKIDKYDLPLTAYRIEGSVFPAEPRGQPRHGAAHLGAPAGAGRR